MKRQLHASRTACAWFQLRSFRVDEGQPEAGLPSRQDLRVGRTLISDLEQNKKRLMHEQYKKLARPVKTINGIKTHLEDLIITCICIDMIRYVCNCVYSILLYCMLHLRVCERYHEGEWLVLRASTVVV